MAEQKDPREPEDLQFRQSEGSGGSPGAEPRGFATRWCAYNDTRERFVSAGVEKAGFSPASVEARLAALTPGSGGALWIIPSRNISPVNIRVPLDLVYLDRDNVVVDTVESFPISPACPCSSLATSILVLPADTIASGGIRRGDYLLLCGPEEMKQRLEGLAHARSDMTSRLNADSGESIASNSDETESRVTADALTSKDRLGLNNPTGTSRVEAMRGVDGQPPVPELAPSPENVESGRPRKGMKNWLRRLLWGEPSDPRKTSRESLAWLVAYFFTGGTPVAHSVRDVSLTGLYVLTEERWYLGTVIRITLTDRRDPSVDRSLTLNAKVVRWGSDGIGLEFVLRDDKMTESCMASTFDDRFVQVSKVQIEQFLRRIRTGTR